MNRIIYRQSVESALIGIVGSSAAIVISLYFGISRNDFVIPCIMAPLFAIALGLFIRALKDHSPKVILDDEGIAAKEWGGMKLYWSDIRDVKVITIPRMVSVTLELQDDNKYLARLSKEQRFVRQMNKRMVGQPFGFNPIALNASTEQIRADIKRHLH